MHVARHGALGFLLLVGACSTESPPQQHSSEHAHFGDNNAESVFQRVEVLRYSLTQIELERQRLEALQMSDGVQPPIRYQSDEGRPSQ